MCEQFQHIEILINLINWWGKKHRKALVLVESEQTS
jgi:hypothetical protein